MSHGSGRRGDLRGSLLNIADVLQHVILPLLSARDLVSLSCSSRGLRQLAYNNDAAWVLAARYAAYVLGQLLDRCFQVRHVSS